MNLSSCTLKLQYSHIYGLSLDFIFPYFRASKVSSIHISVLSGCRASVLPCFRASVLPYFYAFKLPSFHTFKLLSFHPSPTGVVVLPAVRPAPLIAFCAFPFLVLPSLTAPPTVTPLLAISAVLVFSLISAIFTTYTRTCSLRCFRFVGTIQLANPYASCVSCSGYTLCDMTAPHTSLRCVGWSCGNKVTPEYGTLQRIYVSALPRSISHLFHVFTLPRFRASTHPRVHAFLLLHCLTSACLWF